MKEIRQPIVTVAGHVDHGKTSILDSIRGTKIQEKEAGGITQKISFTLYPKESILERAGKILKKFNIPLVVPGILFIDTPGHSAFTNIRRRGGSLADIAVLVVDVNEGIKPQTKEVLEILKFNKTPFVIALNKIDNISGWEKGVKLEEQSLLVRRDFEEKFYTLVGSLHSFGLDAELYYKIKDFTQKVAVIACSARTGQGIEELLAVIVALSQKFLMKRMELGRGGKGVILEVIKRKEGSYLESILYDGELSINEEIAIASFDDVIFTKVRSLQVAKPLNKGYTSVRCVKAAAGIRVQVSDKSDVLAGMPFVVAKGDAKEIKEELKSEISEEIKLDKTGIIVKADSLGSLEALLMILRHRGIKVVMARIGPITKKDIYSAVSMKEEERVILGFNVGLSDDIEVDELKKVKIITGDVVYKIVEDFEEWRIEKLKEIERRKLEGLPSIVMLEVLDFVFRNSNPAIFGVRVLGGVLKKGMRLIDGDDDRVGYVKEIQEERNSISEAGEGKEVAIAVPGVNFERQLSVGEILYGDISEAQFRKFRECRELLSPTEKTILSKIAEIKRREKISWGI